MLHRSFKSSKCKTALNLAKSRIKLLKNKKEAQIKHMRRELAQLLQSGQDPTARIRVEHVVREEKMMVAYELIEIYCELIVARMPIIESQKNCPLDLKEAITSLIFAAQRCGDIPELQDVSKNFTAKYGKEFAAAAMELRPQCGVCRTLVEKLSVKAPDVQTKLKILHAIAEEHNVKWEGFDYEEDPVPSMDTPVVPLGDKVNQIQMESLDFLIPKNVPQHAHDNIRSDSSSQNHARPKINSDESSQGAASHYATVPERTSQDLNQSSGASQSSFPTDRPNWKAEHMEAITAAQSAAKSAERANAAAREAAEYAKAAEHMNVDPPGAVVPPPMHDQNDTNSGTHYESKRENRREIDHDSDSDSEGEYNVFASSYDQKHEDKPTDNPFHGEAPEVKNQPSRSQSGAFRDEYNVFSNKEKENSNAGLGYEYFGSFNHGHREKFENQRDNEEKGFGADTDAPAVFDEARSEDEFIFSPEENPYDLFSRAKSSQGQSSFHQQHSFESYSNQPFPYLDEFQASESVRMSPNYSKLHEPPPIASHRTLSGNDRGPRNNNTYPEDSHLHSETQNYKRWDEDATFSMSSPQMRESSNRKTNPLRWDEDATSSMPSPQMRESPNKKTDRLRWDEDATSSTPSPQMRESSNKKTNPLRWDEDATSSRSSPRMGESSEECQCLHTSVPESPITPKAFLDQGASNSSKPVPSENNDISTTPRHVHPKLPDFEALTAHMKSLRTNSR